MAAIAGGLAGLKYGYESIPKGWLTTIARSEYIESLCNKLFLSVSKTGIERLCSYIPYFETASVDSVCQWSRDKKLGDKHYTMPYPIYERTLKDFIKDVYMTNLICYNYLDVINKLGMGGTDRMIVAIDTADFNLVRAILTGYVRQERFCDGFWQLAVEEKVFLKILKRLEVLKAAM